MVYKNNSHRGCPYMTPDGKRGGGSAKSDFILIGALANSKTSDEEGRGVKKRAMDSPIPITFTKLP